MSRARSYGIAVVVVVAASLLAYSAYRRKGSGTDADVRAAIAAAIHQQHDSITITDRTSASPVRLAFDHVHDQVEATPGGRYFACVDFRSASGPVYDVDYYVGRHGGKLTVEDIALHEVGGKTVIACSTRVRLDAAP